MARTMLDEYKTSDRFWAEAINTACYSINRLYLHRILKKTSYELLTGKKPNVSYFWVFGSKYFILVKRGRKSKFAPKAVEGFLLGYDSNTREYRVFNKSTGLAEVSCDIVFDETNGSQVEQVDLDELDDEEAPCVALRNMSIGNVCPKESEEPPQAQDQPSSSNQASPPTQDEDQAQDNENEDQEDESPQEEDNDQGGDDHDKDKKDECWGSSASEGPQKRDLTMFSKYASRYLRNQESGCGYTEAWSRRSLTGTAIMTKDKMITKLYAEELRHHGGKGKPT
jgi:hypothetical protein